MNITYWLIVSALLALALLIIIPPLWKKRTIEEADAVQRNIKIAQERVRDLKQQLQASALTQQQFDEQYEDLELNLADDMESGSVNAKSWSQGRWVVPVIVILVPLFSILTYLQLGETDALTKAQQAPPQQATGQSELDVNAMVTGLARRLNENPDNPQGWLMLGRSYKYLQQFKLAVNAYENAYALIGDEPEVMLHYADALAMANGGKLAGKASKLVFKALEKEPNSVMGLWLGGMAKTEIGEFAEAMQIWRKLETLIPPDSESFRQLQTLIASTKAQAPDIDVPARNIPKPAALPSINVQVSIAEAIKAKVNQRDTVFIYAKALTGPPMPLAIVRKQVADLPLTVILDDSMAMMPNMKISNFEQVTIMARISKSGTAMPQKGDFIGAVKSAKLAGAISAVIKINEEIK